MKMLRIFIMVAAALLAAACGGERQLPSVVGIEVVSTEWPMPSGVAAADTGDSSAAWPSGVTVRLTIDNPAGSVVLRSIPANATAIGTPARVVRRRGEPVHPSDDLDQQDFPDVLQRELESLRARLQALERTSWQAGEVASGEDL